jgi:hypothetical protein
MSRLLLALALGFALGGPPLQSGVVGLFEAAGGIFDPNGGAGADAGGQFDPDGGANADAGGRFDPNGASADAGNQFDPDG